MIFYFCEPFCFHPHTNGRGTFDLQAPYGYLHRTESAVYLRHQRDAHISIKHVLVNMQPVNHNVFPLWCHNWVFVHLNGWSSHTFPDKNLTSSKHYRKLLMFCSSLIQFPFIFVIGYYTQDLLYISSMRAFMGKSVFW